MSATIARVSGDNSLRRLTAGRDRMGFLTSRRLLRSTMANTLAVPATKDLERKLTRTAPPPLKITKREGAIRQIESAIEAFWRGDFDVVITLALAAEGMAGPCEDSLFAKQIADVPVGFNPKEWRSIVNSERDWLKHPNIDVLGAETTIDAHDASYAIARALSRWDEWTAPMQAFKDWYIPFVRTTAHPEQRSFSHRS